ncbi:hypothetical protein TNIN_111661 [Trichonephila inaurata madagascariensis]|uniref:SCAN domain-containing protein n=1 Tax=Trichonephila inaurata madagascariensis TaxID=2747483 RepID=A0A8X6XFB4_9ARAC|nr:hypothetical protein TNIN_111661 [Trichonephila inaurata madagascariensis]
MEVDNSLLGIKVMEPAMNLSQDHDITSTPEDLPVISLKNNKDASKDLLVPELIDYNASTSKDVPAPESINGNASTSKDLLAPKLIDYNVSASKDLLAPEFINYTASVSKGLLAPEFINYTASASKDQLAPELISYTASISYDLSMVKSTNNNTSVSYGLPAADLLTKKASNFEDVHKIKSFSLLTTGQLETVNNSTSTPASTVKTSVVLLASEGKAAVNDSKTCVVSGMKSTGAHSCAICKNQVHAICGNAVGEEGPQEIGTSAGIIKDWLPRNALQIATTTFTEIVPWINLSLRKIAKKNYPYLVKDLRSVPVNNQKYNVKQKDVLVKKSNVLCNSRYHKSTQHVLIKINEHY